MSNDLFSILTQNSMMIITDVPLHARTWLSSSNNPNWTTHVIPKTSYESYCCSLLTEIQLLSRMHGMPSMNSQRSSRRKIWKHWFLPHGKFCNRLVLPVIISLVLHSQRVSMQCYQSSFKVSCMVRRNNEHNPL